jgi:hypothetical protein
VVGVGGGAAVLEALCDGSKALSVEVVGFEVLQAKSVLAAVSANQRKTSRRDSFLFM